VDYAASAPIVEEKLAKKMGVWKRARKVNVKQRDGTNLSEENFVVNTMIQIFQDKAFIGKFSLDAEVLDIGNKDLILGLSWLVENGFMVDTEGRCLRYVNTGMVIKCSVQWIPSVTLLDLDLKPMVDGEVLLIIDVRERYSRYTQAFSSEQAARLSEYSPGTTKSHLSIPRLGYQLELSTRLHGKGIRHFDNTYNQKLLQGRSVVPVLQQALLSCLYKKRMVPLGSMLTIGLLIALPCPTNIHSLSLANS